MGALLALGIMCPIAWALVKQANKWMDYVLSLQNEILELRRVENAHLQHVLEARLFVKPEEEDKKEPLH